MPDPEFCQEIKDQYSRLLDNRNNLDSKANNIIAMAGTIVTLLMGFGTFILKSIKLEYAFLDGAIFFLVLGILLMIAGIIFSLLTYRIQPKTFPIGHEAFYTDGKYDIVKVDSFRISDHKVFYKRMIEEYVISIKENALINSSKSNLIKVSQRLFLAGIFTIPIITAFLIHAMLTSNLISGSI